MPKNASRNLLTNEHRHPHVDLSLEDCQNHECFRCKGFATRMTSMEPLRVRAWCLGDSTTFPNRCEMYDEEEFQSDDD